jgi:deoxyinosine 3'endonuclease (endonuclease V)
MKISQLHRWNVSIEKAKQIQLERIEKIRLEILSAEIRFIAGADVSSANDENISFAPEKFFSH